MRYDVHVHRRDELGADLFDTTAAEGLAVDAAAVFLDEVGLDGGLAEWSGGLAAGESSAVRDGTLEGGEIGLEAIDDAGAVALDVPSRDNLVATGTARATFDMATVADDLDGVSKNFTLCQL